MSAPDRFVYGIIRKRYGWRTLIHEYKDGACTYSQAGGTAYTNKRDCAVSARELAEDLGRLYQRPVEAFDEYTRKLAAPVQQQPALFPLRDDARPVAARDAGTRYQEPGLFDL